MMFCLIVLLATYQAGVAYCALPIKTIFKITARAKLKPKRTGNRAIRAATLTGKVHIVN